MRGAPGRGKQAGVVGLLLILAFGFLIGFFGTHLFVAYARFVMPGFAGGSHGSSSIGSTHSTLIWGSRMASGGPGPGTVDDNMALDAAQDFHRRKPNVITGAQQTVQSVQKSVSTATLTSSSAELSHRAPTGRKQGIHMVVTTNGNVYMNWQTRILYKSFQHQAQISGSGLVAFTRILHRTTPDELMEDVPTFRVNPLHPDCDVWCDFPVADRATAFRAWMRTPDAQQCEFILLGETDYIFVKPLPVPTFPLGKGIGFPFGYIIPTYPTVQAVMRRYYTEAEGPLTDIPGSGNAPTLLHYEDFLRVAPLWEEYTAKIEEDEEAKEKFGWVREMYAFSIALAKAKVKVDLTPPPHNLLMSQPPTDHVMGDAAIIHYTWGAEVYNRTNDDPPKYTMVWTWDKRTYMGGQYHSPTSFALARLPALPPWAPNTLFLQEWFKHQEVTKDLWETLSLEAQAFNRAVDEINAFQDGLPRGFTTMEAAVEVGKPGPIAVQARQEVERREREAKAAKAEAAKAGR